MIDVVLATLAGRFQGVDLQYRRTTTCSYGAWPAPWRARLLTSKNERAKYRLTVHGATQADAVMALHEAVDRADRPDAERLGPVFRTGPWGA